MILSAFAFSIMALFVKLVGDHGIPVLEIVAARSLISLVISYLGLRREGIAVLGTRKGLWFCCPYLCVLCNYPFALSRSNGFTVSASYVYCVISTVFFKRGVKSWHAGMYCFKFFRRINYSATGRSVLFNYG